MNKFCIYLILIVSLSLLFSCHSKKKTPAATLSKSERITRSYQEIAAVKLDKTEVERELYPWEEGNSTVFPKLTKEFFRCKGSGLNPVNIITNEKEEKRFYDCGGAQRHSLPLRDKNEFIYPILIDLLNYLQNRTQKRVVITCGHCCPDHNLYLDPSVSNQSSKHLIGAEVDFYIQGMEWEPEKVVQLIMNYYLEQGKYANMKEYQEFKRYNLGRTNVSTLPWYNREIFIKLVKKSECRDFDNRHPYPYLTVQVRYDWDMKEQVSYSWDKAFRNFHRW